jgi:hypothetical protein
MLCGQIKVSSRAVVFFRKPAVSAACFSRHCRTDEGGFPQTKGTQSAENFVIMHVRFCPVAGWFSCLNHEGAGLKDLNRLRRLFFAALVVILLYCGFNHSKAVIVFEAPVTR